MSKQEVRAQRIQVWLEHLRRCKAAGGSVASYAKEHGLPTWALYQWRSRLVRDGLWPAKIREAKPVPRSQIVPVCFARVAVTAPAPAYVVRLQLNNGRRAEIELAQIDPLIQLISALEQQP
jgi:hypothetical protein